MTTYKIIKDQILMCTVYDIENGKKIAENHYEDPSIIMMETL